MSVFQEALALLGEAPTASPHPAFDDYERLLPRLEAAMWAAPDTRRVHLFQAFCREMEARVPPEIAARRHRIVVVVPVADRPRQLAACIDSLVACQAAFAYRGGVSLVVAEDSAGAEHCAAHRRLLEGLEGVDAHYLGLETQKQLLEALSERAPAALRAFVGEQWRARMGHKGASVTRNIAMLWLARQDFGRALYHFIDSDQAFHVDLGAARPRYMLNYFYHLDRLFRAHDISALTGKVVGDPPVSPAVMAGTLLDDVLRVAETVLAAPGRACDFHAGGAGPAHGAYHDMAALFGLDNRADDWRYACPLQGPHSQAEALAELAGRLLRFFDGEHPTRVTPFAYQPVEPGLAPARTVYTGNYVIDRRALAYGIPFAPMKLRMAGPTLGRLLQADLGAGFAQAGLPLLHQRTEAASGRAEFRPGVAHQAGRVDLSGEYQRQFIGDWMLFGMVELVGRGYPEQADAALIDTALAGVERRLLDEYAATRARVMQRLARLEALLDDPSRPWQADGTMRRAQRDLGRFARSVRDNYSERSPAVARIDEAAFRAEWRARLRQALLAYPAQARDWAALMRTLRQD